jgi:predicted nucleotidyltransferase component of viral defense system
MQDLIAQERFEIEVLEKMNSAKLLSPLIFGGGSMLRLCYGMNRFSVDLDFWFRKEIAFEKFFLLCRETFSTFYRLKDAAQKHHTLLFEIASPDYPRVLKIEIRKEIKKVKTEDAIAFSPYSRHQVLVRVISLEAMMREKIQALLKRREIRDCFDIEFLLKRGVEMSAKPEVFPEMLTIIEGFRKQDYTVKLGSLLDVEDRRFYRANNFKFLLTYLRGKIAT